MTEDPKGTKPNPQRSR